MDDCGGLGQLRAGPVVVGDDQVQAQAAGGVGGIEGGDAAIDGYEEGRAVFGDGFDGFDVEAVAFFDAMGDVVVDAGAEESQELPKDGDPGYAVNVIVAVHGKLFTGLDCLLYPPYRRWYAGHQFRGDEFGKLGA